jgi:phosphoserine phosphatase RsbU/P
MLRILVIDDDPTNQMFLQSTLQTITHDVVLATTSEAGIRLAKQLQPALIICAGHVSGIEGIEICHIVKADPRLRSTFFILLTDRNTVEDRIIGLDAGADDCLSQPIARNELQARVRAGFRLYRSAHSLHQLAQELQAKTDLLEGQLFEAADYVRSLLPKPSQGKVAIDSRFLPSRELGGDCFDYYWLDPDYLMIYLLDVSGHGLGSALPSVFVQNLLRTQSLPGTNFYQPSSVLRALNEAFQMSEQNEQYFTIWYGIYNHQKRQLFYASAGHPAAVLLTQSAGQAPQVQRLKTRGSPIGMFPNAKYVTARCNVGADSTLYIFSDGIYEIIQNDGTLWSLDSFIQLLLNCSATQTLHLDDLLKKVMLLNQSKTFNDDCSILQVKF